METSVADTVIDLFYRHQFAGTSPLIHPLEGAGGFSGAKFWRIETDLATWCLRRWPKSVNREERHLLWIHRQLSGAYSRGCEFIPVPVIASTQETLAEHQDYFWQLEPWMPGKADFHSNPTRPRLIEAMRALAKFHRAVRELGVRKQPSPGLTTRLRRLSELHDAREPTRLLRDIENAIETASNPPNFHDVASHIQKRFQALAPPLFERLKHANQIAVPTQTVIGDIWHDHVLYSSDVVTGLVDFGTMRMDTPACDIARLLGSLVGDQCEDWLAGIEAWESIGPLPQQERILIDLFDQTTTLISGINWLQWLFLEHRTFENLKIILRRLDSIARRMDFMAANL